MLYNITWQHQDGHFQSMEAKATDREDAIKKGERLRKRYGGIRLTDVDYIGDEEDEEEND